MSTNEYYKKLSNYYLYPNGYGNYPLIEYGFEPKNGYFVNTYDEVEGKTPKGSGCYEELINSETNLSGKQMLEMLEKSGVEPPEHHKEQASKNLPLKELSPIQEKENDYSDEIPF